MSGPYATDFTTLLTGSYWNGIQQAGRPVFVTYSFDATAPASDQSHLNASAFATFKPYSAAQQAQAQQALADWSGASGITFLQVAPGQGDVNFASYNFSTDPGAGDAGGQAYYPWGKWNNATYPYFAADAAGSGNVLMNTQYETGGLFSMATVLHEIGHALGLKHPDQPWTLYGPPTPVAYNSWNPTVSGGHPAADQTVMNEGATTLAALGPLDVQAIQAIYGAPSLRGSEDSVPATWNAATDTLTQHVRNGGSVEVRGISTNNLIYGGSGADTIMAVGAGVNTVYGGAGPNLLVGGSGTNYLHAGSGATTLMGGPGVDSLHGGSSYLYAGTGNDTFYGAFDYAGSNANGHSYADFLLVSSGVEVDLAQPWLNKGQAAHDTFWGIHNVVGTNSNDTIIGDNGDGTFYARGDHLSGLGGNDLIVGGTGPDTIACGSGLDTVSGGGGADLLLAGTGTDIFQYGALADSTPTGYDTIIGFSDALGDRIDLTALEGAMHETFRFIGTAAFDGRPGEIREAASGGNLFVSIDTSGSKAADFTVEFTKLPSIQAVDFRL